MKYCVPSAKAGATKLLKPIAAKRKQMMREEILPCLKFIRSGPILQRKGEQDAPVRKRAATEETGWGNRAVREGNKTHHDKPAAVKKSRRLTEQRASSPCRFDRAWWDAKLSCWETG
jgi:hypothetical protein